MMNTYPIIYQAALVIDDRLSRIMQTTHDYNRAKAGLPNNLSKQDLETITKHGIIAAQNMLSKEYANQCGMSECADMFRDEYDDENMVYCTEFDGSAESIASETDNPIALSFDSDYLLLFEPDIMPSPFQSRCYANVQEIVTEFQHRMKNYLPENFDLTPYIMSVSGTYFC